MNAVVIRAYEFDESELMPINEEHDLQILVAKLETNVEHIREDVSEIKVELRGTNQRIDALSEKMDKRFDALIGDTNRRFEKVDARFDAAKAYMDTRFDEQDARMDARFDKQDACMDTRFDKQDARMDRIEDKVNGILVRLESWKVWALGLYFALAAALLGVMAKGFKWF